MMMKMKKKKMRPPPPPPPLTSRPPSVLMTLPMIRSLSSSLLALALFALVPAHAAEPIPDANKVGGFAIGCQAYSFNRYSVFEAIEKTAEVGAKVIEFYPGQKLTPDDATKWGGAHERQAVDGHHPAPHLIGHRDLQRGLVVGRVELKGDAGGEEQQSAADD